jgi:hypothetical protein
MKLTGKGRDKACGLLHSCQCHVVKIESKMFLVEQPNPLELLGLFVSLGLDCLRINKTEL